LSFLNCFVQITGLFWQIETVQRKYNCWPTSSSKSICWCQT